MEVFPIELCTRLSTASPLLWCGLNPMLHQYVAHQVISTDVCLQLANVGGENCALGLSL